VSLSHPLVSLIRFESALALRPRKLELFCGASSVKLSVGVSDCVSLSVVERFARQTF
jgi:hypothetical protein